MKSIVENLVANHEYLIDEAKSAAVQRVAASSRQAAFEKISDALEHTHCEDEFDDFERHSLLLNRLSQLGPGVTWYDIDGDQDHIT